MSYYRIHYKLISDNWESKSDVTWPDGDSAIAVAKAGIDTLKMQWVMVIHHTSAGKIVVWEWSSDAGEEDLEKTKEESGVGVNGVAPEADTFTVKATTIYETDEVQEVVWDFLQMGVEYRVASSIYDAARADARYNQVMMLRDSDGSIERSFARTKPIPPADVDDMDWWAKNKHIIVAAICIGIGSVILCYLLYKYTTLGKKTPVVKQVGKVAEEVVEKVEVTVDEVVKEVKK